MTPISRWTTELVEDATLGRKRIVQHGHEVPFKLNKRERDAFELAKGRGYLVHAYSAVRAHLGNAWGAWCEATRMPFVVAMTRSVAAEIHVDMLVTNEVISATAYDELVQLRQTHDRASPRDPSAYLMRFDSTVCFYLKRVPKAEIDSAARALATIARSHRMMRAVDFALEIGLRPEAHRTAKVLP